jgi:hypothetical protein
MKICPSLPPILDRSQDFYNLFRIDRRGRAAKENLHFPASGLVDNCRYFRFDFLTRVKPNPDVGAYTVIHTVSIPS